MSFIKLDKKILQWQWHDNPIMWSVWTHILLKANYKEELWHGHLIPRGSFITSRDHFAKECGISIRQLRTSLSRLKTTNEIAIKTTKSYTMISVIKYDEYQGVDEKSTNKLTNKMTNELSNERPTNDQRTTTTKEDKEVREDKEFKNIKDLSELDRALLDFEEMRKRKKAPLTTKAKQMILKKLEQIAPTDEEKIDVLNQSTMNGWTSIYPLNNKKGGLIF